jgi:hypothetical protein
MKKIKTILVLLILMPTIIKSQNLLGTYTTIQRDKPFEIKITVKNNRWDEMYIYAHTEDRMTEKGGLIIREASYNRFIKKIQEAKKKYIEWKEVALQNEVKELRKNTNVRNRQGVFFYYGDKWCHSYYQPIYFYFMVVSIDNKPEFFLSIETDVVFANQNQYMKTRGYSISFRTIEEIDVFLETISLDKINKHIESKSKEDLFK